MKPVRLRDSMPALPVAGGWKAAEPICVVMTSAAITAYEDTAHGTNVTAPATATPATIRRLRRPRSASTPKTSCSPLPAMVPIVAIRPAFTMSRWASVLKTGQMPVQQSTAKWPPTSASSVQ